MFFSRISWETELFELEFRRFVGLDSCRHASMPIIPSHLEAPWTASKR